MIALSTLIPGLIGALGSADQATKDLIIASENNKDKLEAFSSAAQSYNQVLEKLKDETLTNAEKQKILSDSNESLATILSNTPTELQKSLKDAISAGNFDNITQYLGKIQIALQTSATNTDNLANIIQIATDNALEPKELQRFTDTILNFKTTKGTSLAGEIVRNPKLGDEFNQEIKSVLIALQERNAKYGQGTPVIGRESVGGMSEDQIFAPTITGAQGSIVSPNEANLIKETAAILGPIRNLLLKAGLDKETTSQVLTQLEKFSFNDLDQGSFALIQRFKELGIDTKSLNKEIKEVTKKFLKDDFLRRAGLAGDVSSNPASADAFRKNIDVKSLQEYSKEVLDKDMSLNANRIATTRVLDAQQQIYSSILNETERRKVNAKFIEQTNNLQKKGVIDLDKFSLAVQGSQEELVALNQRARGLMFAEDFRGARQAAREKRILGGDTKLEDFPASFFDEFDNRTEDSYREAQQGAKDTARTIKSEFNNAFLSFANGTETASDAFSKMALNISNRIQQLALEFATNQLFGALFGSTSNIFGGGGGGGAGIFGNLFGKSNGGIIKGYSSGGNVNGGSGTRDDIPAMLTEGEYVIKKSAVKKYGSNYLEMLNQGKVKKKAYGGEVSFAEENTFKNDYEPIKISETGQTIYRPQNGQSSTGLLNLQAIYDSNNPQNELRNQMEAKYYENINRIDDYLRYVEDVKKQNEEAYQENVKLNQEIRNQYNRQKSAASKGAWMSFGLGILGAGASQFSSMGGFGGNSASKYGASAALGGGSAARQNYGNTAPLRYSTPTPRANGGFIRGFANGGSSGKDDIPALLMGGEFVMRKEAVNSYGKNFFDDLNSGRVKKFATGGKVGDSVFNPQKTEMYSPTNNVSVTINLNNTSEKGNNEMNKGGSTNNQKESEDAKVLNDLGIKIKNEVMKVITQQQRPGGLLRK
jgi:hypothetical protein